MLGKCLFYCALFLLFASFVFAQTQNLPDLVITNAIVGLGRTPNDLRADAVVQNIGAATANSVISLQAKLFKDGVYVPNKDILTGINVNIGANSAYQVFAGDFTNLDLGNYKVKLFVDNQNIITELDENNNFADTNSMLIPVPAQNLPDLIVEEIKLQDNTGAEISSLLVGQKPQGISAKIKNIGATDVSAPYFITFYYVDSSNSNNDWQQEVFSNVPIRSGAFANVDIIFDKTILNAGQHIFKVVVDYASQPSNQNMVPEFNENNNELSKIYMASASTQDLPDLIVESIKIKDANDNIFPSTAFPDVIIGQEVSVFSTIKNVGAAQVNAQFPVTFYYTDNSAIRNYWWKEERSPTLLQPGQSVSTIPLRQVIADAGPHTFKTIADYVDTASTLQGNIVQESNENNNENSVVFNAIQRTPTPAQPSIIVDYSINNEVLFEVFQSNRLIMPAGVFGFLQLADSSRPGWAQFGVNSPRLPDGETIARLRYNFEDVGQITIVYNNASNEFKVKNLQITGLKIPQSSIGIVNFFLSANLFIEIVSNTGSLGALFFNLKINSINDFPADKIIAANVLRQNNASGQIVDETVGSIKINASSFDFQSIQRVVNYFSGKITTVENVPVTNGIVCAEVAGLQDFCQQIYHSSNNGMYSIRAQGKDNDFVLFKVNSVDAGTKQLDAAEGRVTFDLQVPVSAANVQDSDKDTIPDGIDNCPDSLVPIVDINGCDCSQKHCGVGNKCEPDLFEGNRCVSVPIQLCSQKSVCLEKNFQQQAAVYDSVHGEQSAGAATNYVIDGKEYVIAVVSILESANNGVGSAKFEINGQDTGELFVGQEFSIQSVVKITVTNITNSTNQTLAKVSFSLTSFIAFSQTNNDAPKYCNQNGVVINNCQKCGCPAEFTCGRNGDCVKVLTGLVGSVCKDNDFKYSLTPINCPVGWIKEDVMRYLSIDVDGPPFIEDYAKDEVEDKLKEVTLCLKTSDLGCAPADQPYKCRFEDLLGQNRGTAARIIEDMVNRKMPSSYSYEDLGTGLRIGLGFATGGLLEILDLAGLMDIDFTPHVDLTGFNLRSMYDCAPKLISSDFGCTSMINNGPSDKRVDLVFVGDGFFDDKSFEYAVKQMIDYESVNANTNNEGLFSIEPYKSAKTKFNVWVVNAKDSISHEKKVAWSDYGDVPSEHDVTDFVSYCSNKDYVVVISKSNYGSHCYFGGPCFVSISDERYPGRLLSHEFGHGFGKLGDEYAHEATELKDAPNRVEDLVTGIQANYPNCKPTDLEAQQAWGSIITQSNKLGYFKSCGGDCMPFCAGAVRPTLNSVMRHQEETVDNPADCVLGTCKYGAPFDQYYAVNYREIQKELDKYEAGNPDDTVFGYLESTEQAPQQNVPSSGVLKTQKTHDCRLNTVCDLPIAPYASMEIDVDDPSKGTDGDVVVDFNVNEPPITMLLRQLTTIKMSTIPKPFSEVTYQDCQNSVSAAVAYTMDFSGNQITVCVQGNNGTITKLGNTEILKTTKSTIQPNGDVLNQLVFVYSINYAILSYG